MEVYLSQRQKIMIDIVGVRFKKAGKIYYFDPKNLSLEVNQDVIVQTSRGVEYGTIVIANKKIRKDSLKNPLKEVIRIASEYDKKKHLENIEDAHKAMEICEEKIKKHGLEMKLIDSEYTFKRNKIIFYFTADGRVDFRSLVRDLASIFKTRIELRQIGVRDEAKMIGTLGVCGRKTCCSYWKTGFDSISINMAKDQSLSLNPAKISGQCGRLMCCIKYEHETYVKLSEEIPESGTKVNTPDGRGYVRNKNILDQSVNVVLNDKSNQTYSSKKYKITDIEILSKNGKG